MGRLLLLSLLLVLLFSLGQTLAIAIEPIGDPQTPDFRRGPKGTADDQGHHDPIVPPTGQGLGAAGNQRIVVHPGTVDGQSSFAAERVVHGQLDHARWGKHQYHHFGQDFAQDIERPSRVAEEAMVATVVAPTGTTAGPDQLRDKTTSMGKNPSCHQAQEGLETWRGEDASELG